MAFLYLKKLFKFILKFFFLIQYTRGMILLSQLAHVSSLGGINGQWLTFFGLEDQNTN